MCLALSCIVILPLAATLAISYRLRLALLVISHSVMTTVLLSPACHFAFLVLRSNMHNSPQYQPFTLRNNQLRLHNHNRRLHHATTRTPAATFRGTHWILTTSSRLRAQATKLSTLTTTASTHGSRRHDWRHLTSDRPTTTTTSLRHHCHNTSFSAVFTVPFPTLILIASILSLRALTTTT